MNEVILARGRAITAAIRQAEADARSLVADITADTAGLLEDAQAHLAAAARAALDMRTAIGVLTQIAAQAKARAT